MLCEDAPKSHELHILFAMGAVQYLYSRTVLLVMENEYVQYNNGVSSSFMVYRYQEDINLMRLRVVH